MSNEMQCNQVLQKRYWYEDGYTSTICTNRRLSSHTSLIGYQVAGTGLYTHQTDTYWFSLFPHLSMLGNTHCQILNAQLIIQCSRTGWVLPEFNAQGVDAVGFRVQGLGYTYTCSIVSSTCCSGFIPPSKFCLFFQQQKIGNFLFSVVNSTNFSLLLGNKSSKFQYQKFGIKENPYLPISMQEVMTS